MLPYQHRLNFSSHISFTSKSLFRNKFIKITLWSSESLSERLLQIVGEVLIRSPM